MVEIPVYKTHETVEERKLPFTGSAPITSYEKTSWTEQIGTKTMPQNIPVAQIEPADKATGNIEIVNAGTQHINPSYGSTTSGKDSGSGSSGSSGF